MGIVRAIFKFNSKYPGTYVDTTARSGPYLYLSPFSLPAPPAKNLENLWQFSKVYPELEHYSISSGRLLPGWRTWRDAGWADPVAHRYPMGKGRKPLFSNWNGKQLGYIDARKQIYATEYAKNVILTDSYQRLLGVYNSGVDIILRDYDAYDHIALGMSLVDVINNPNKIMGHAFVLIMLLEGKLDECVNSPTTGE